MSETKVLVIAPIMPGEIRQSEVEEWGYPVLSDSLSPHDRSRSYLASRAMASDAEVFLWVDADTGATKEQAYDLIDSLSDHDVGLMTGVYVCRHEAELGNVALNFNPVIEKGKFLDIRFYEHGGVHAIHACGFGFVATTRELFEAVKAPPARYVARDGSVWKGRAWFLPEMQGEDHLGEDRSFCLRAQSFQMAVDTRICVHHDGYTLKGLLNGQKKP